MDNFSQDEEHDASFEVLPSLTPQQQAQLDKQYKQRLTNFYGKNRKYQIDNWYSAIKQFTYHSFPFPLSAIQAYLLHCLYYQYHLSEQLLRIQENLTNKITNLLEQNISQQNKGKYFMKLSTRSPKDYCWDYRDKQQFNKAVENLKKYLKQQNVTLQTSINKLTNILYKFFLINSHQRLMISNGKDFVKIFSKSERIITDINDYSYLAGGVFEKIKHNKATEEEKHQFFINVWVRDWDNCQWSQQFRSFYNNYKLTAISQYDQRCYFEELVSQKEQIAQRCTVYFQKVKPHLQGIGLDKGVLDFIVKPTEIKIVQINVFDKDARSSLFNWNDDAQILQHGPLQVRVLQKQVQISKAHLGSIMGMIDKNSSNVITTALEQSNLLSLWK